MGAAKATATHVATENLVYVRTATSGRHGVPVQPGEDVPTDALPGHVETLVNLGLVKAKPAPKTPAGGSQGSS